MISITRNGTQVVLEFTIEIPLDAKRVFPFSWNAGSEWAAGFLANAMRNALNEAVKNARSEEYEAGWRHARSHRTPKCAWFTSKLVK